MFEVIATGVAKLTCCQPDAVSPLKVAVASFVPALLHRLPTCVPVLVGAPIMAPLMVLSANPPGRDPLAIDQAYGVVPPVAKSVAE